MWGQLNPSCRIVVSAIARQGDHTPKNHQIGNTQNALLMVVTLPYRMFYHSPLQRGVEYFLQSVFGTRNLPMFNVADSKLQIRRCH